MQKSTGCCVDEDHVDKYRMGTNYTDPEVKEEKMSYSGYVFQGICIIVVAIISWLLVVKDHDLWVVVKKEPVLQEELLKLGLTEVPINTIKDILHEDAKGTQGEQVTTDSKLKDQNTDYEEESRK